MLWHVLFHGRYLYYCGTAQKSFLTTKVAHSLLSFTVKNSSKFVSIDNPFLFFLSVARRVAVPDERWDFLCDFHKPARYSNIKCTNIFCLESKALFCNRLLILSCNNVILLIRFWLFKEVYCKGQWIFQGLYSTTFSCPNYLLHFGM